MAHTAYNVFYEGRVQGVGFRYTVKQIAMGYDVAGWVKNLPDGRVELEAHGEKDEAEAFLVAIERCELRAHIARVEKREAEARKDVKGFEIRFY